METGNRLTLTSEEQARVQQAVEAAERLTSAEIVPMIVGRSGLYRDAWNRVGLGAAGLAFALLLTVEVWWLPWGWHAANAVWLLLAVLLAYGAGWGIGHAAPVIRWVTPADRLRHKVRLRAERAFVQHGLANTRGGNGVLILLSLLEHQVYVLADRPLFDRIPAGTWSEVIAAIVEQVKAGDIVGGLCHGIERCGVVLAQYSPPGSSETVNELSNQPIQEP